MSALSGSSVSVKRSRVGEALLRVSHLAIARTGAKASAEDVFRCKHCGEVIGVYEPLVVSNGGHARTTSRAAEPALETTGATHYHRACYEAGAGEG